jgi:tRNA G10  N-methylase Trm11
MYIAILGRQPEISLAELQCLYGHQKVQRHSKQSAVIDWPDFDFERLGGSQKAGRIVLQLASADWSTLSTKITQFYLSKWHTIDHKQTLGISAYDSTLRPDQLQKLGVNIKQKLKSSGVSVRLVPNKDTALNTATSHHNKLGLSANRTEILIVRGFNGRIIVAESIGAQNITALAARDQARPHTDAFVGMLPPKLARIMVNCAVGQNHHQNQAVLDPFCGTGVVLQEALLLGYDAFGTDLSDKMVDYSKKNLQWLEQRFKIDQARRYAVAQADATNYQWSDRPTAVASETYLGQPFSAPPSPAKLREVTGNCNHIISKFLSNLGSQIAANTPLCIAVPAWRSTTGSWTHLPLIGQLDSLGYDKKYDETLLYNRENQVVGREILILIKK